MIRASLVSVSDKRGLENLIGTLTKFKVRIISSGGTARTIRSLGYDVTEVTEYTGYPESPGGLIKTLHPKIHGGLLLDRSDPLHMKYMAQQGIESIDLLVVNLYPFEKVIQNSDVEFKSAVENIDIGGPAMIRAAAKGSLLHGSPAVIVDPDQYQIVIDEMNRTKGSLAPDTVRNLAIKAFQRTAEYDCAIRNYLMRVSS